MNPGNGASKGGAKEGTGPPFGPTFLIVGAARSGTSSLHVFFEREADVCMARPKETNFFNRNFDQGLDWYRRHHFAHWDGQPAVGESCPGYLPVGPVPARIASTAPDVRLVAVLRDPVARAYSHWWLHRSIGVESRGFRESFRIGIEAIQSEEDAQLQLWIGARGSEGSQPAERAMAARSVYGSLYARQIERYWKAFPREQLLVVRLDDLASAPEAALRRICDHVGVTPRDARLEKANTSASRAEARMSRAARQARLFEIGRRVLPRPVRMVGRRLLAGASSRPKLTEEDRRWCLPYLADEIDRIEALLGWDLSAWKDPRVR